MKPLDFTKFACNLKGVALMALQNAEFALNEKTKYCDDLDPDYRMILEGRYQAYADILQLITGFSTVSQWKESINAMN